MTVALPVVQGVLDVAKRGQNSSQSYVRSNVDKVSSDSSALLMVISYDIPKIAGDTPMIMVGCISVVAVRTLSHPSELTIYLYVIVHNIAIICGLLVISSSFSLVASEQLPSPRVGCNHL